MDIFHRMGRLFEGIVPTLIEEYRLAPVKHADETGWRTNGKNGYAWLFATLKISIFLFKKTRSSSVPRALFGDERLPGTLVVDRYNGYNKMPCDIQYCYSHLLREVEDLEKEFPDQTEIKTFVRVVAPLFALAMGLRGQPLSDAQFLDKASEVKAQIKSAMEAPAQHLGIVRIQDIFTEHEVRLYHWADNRQVPADNNLAERDLRPTVIARKVSFGSQSDAGAHTRSVLMTVVHTLRKRGEEVAARLKYALDELAKNKTKDPFPLLFSQPP
jgi:transposase